MPRLKSPKDRDNDDRPSDPGILQQIFHFLWEWRKEKQENERKLIMVIDDLNAALAANTAAINNLIVAYQTPTIPESAIIAATTQINANTEAINKALAPVVPPPVTTP